MLTTYPNDLKILQFIARSDFSCLYKVAMGKEHHSMRRTFGYDGNFWQPMKSMEEYLDWCNERESLVRKGN